MANVVFTPNPGVQGRVNDVVCAAPRGASNQLQTVYSGDSKPSSAPSGYGLELSTRLYNGILVNNIGQ